MTENIQADNFLMAGETSGKWVEYHDAAELHEAPQHSLVYRLVLLVMGFNVGFILPTVLVFLVLPLLLPDFSLRRASGASESPAATEVAAFVVVTGIPTETPLPTQTPESTATPTEAPPSATTEPVTQVAEAPTLEPSPTWTLYPTATLIPPTPTPMPAPISYELSGFKFFLQTWNNCGPANLAMGLTYYGWEGDQKDTASYLKPNRMDKNVSPDQMAAYVNENTDLKAIYRVAGDLDLLRLLVSQHFVVIIESGYTPPNEAWYGHYRLVVGYDDTHGQFHFYDSNLGTAASPMRPESYEAFDRNWQAFNRTYIVIYPPNRETELSHYLGDNFSPTLNWQYAANVAREDANSEPDNAFAWFNLGTALTHLGDYQTAALAFDQARNLGTLPFRMLWYQFAPYEAYFQTSRLDDVLSLAHTALETTSEVEETYYYMGRVFEIRGDLATALQYYEDALENNPNFQLAADAKARVGG